MAKTKADDVVPRHGLRVYPHYFVCPYCARTFERGGRKEGFVKSGASNHVYACWTVGLYLRGYTPGNYTAGHQRALTIAEAERGVREGKIHKNYLRGLKALVAKRRREGVLGLLQPKGAS